MAEDVKGGRFVHWASIGYVVLSILGWFSAGWLFDAAPMAYILGQWILGPLAFAFNLRSEAVGGSLFGVWIVLYVAATVLLFVCVLLFRRRSRFIKGVGVLLGILTWLASGFMNFIVMFRGI
jgi:hypothetical protein